MTPSDDAQAIAETARQLVAQSERIFMMLGNNVQTVIVFPDPDTKINGQYSVVVNDEGVYHLCHLEDGLYDSSFVISYQALKILSGFLTAYLQR